MKNSIIILFLLLGNALVGQALYNSGSLQLHDNANIGFHTNLINDGIFDNVTGLAGFYGDQATLVSGAIAPTFFDVEFGNLSSVFLLNNINVANNVNFISGDVITETSISKTSLIFQENGFYVGENDNSKVIGYAAITNKNDFTFPVGDDNQLRNLILNSVASNDFVQCAYFSEDPSGPISIENTFNRDSRSRDIGAISPSEFWILEGSVTSNVTISWNLNSNLGDLTQNVNNIKVVAWNIAANQWVLLAEAEKGGDINEGFITTDNFLPSDYGAITFGSIAEPQEFLELDNYFLSPNGDGINDVLVIEGTEASPNNILQIYNRQGQKVFEMMNYTNQFRGISNQDNFVLNREIGLPEGIYYYTITLFDLGSDYQGFLFLDR